MSASSLPAPSQPIQLDHDQLLSSLDRLQARIAARFPDESLTALATAIRAAVPDLRDQVESHQRRRTAVTWTARAVTGLLVVGTAVAIALAMADFLSSTHSGDDWLGLVNNVIGDVVYIAIAVAFLWAVPERLGRHDLTQVLHKLRSIAHVIDMHQLGKDPERLRDDYQATDQSLHPHLPHKESAAERRADLHHYLNYCIELLGLVSKSAALCAEHTGDPVVLSMVNDVEALTSDMSAKIFAKLQLLPRT